MIKYIATTVFIIGLSTCLLAQAPPPPPPDHGQTGNQNGGNAPIGSGLVILISLGLAYGGKKVYDWKKEKLEE